MNASWGKELLDSVGNKVVETFCISQTTEKTFATKKYLGEYI